MPPELSGQNAQLDQARARLQDVRVLRLACVHARMRAQALPRTTGCCDAAGGAGWAEALHE